MHFLKIICFLFASTALSATTPTRAGASVKATSTASPKAAAPRLLKPATPPTATDVKNSIENWATSVNTVNDYLNNPTDDTKLQAAIVFAKDEPVQLATLMKVTALPMSGVNAGKVLMGNFPSIVSNLANVKNGTMSTQSATTAVNFNRCCTVLPAIGQLWIAASTATKAVNITMPNLESQCSQMSCESGASAGAVNGTGF